MRWRLPAAFGRKVICERGDWRNKSSRRAAVLLAKIQSDILRLLAAHRDPESYVAGSTPLNVNASRYSGDIDVFHDREERVARAAQEDSAVLQANGYDLHWLRREPAMYSVVTSKGGEATKLEWTVAQPDPDRLDAYQTHAGQRRGHWPSSPEIAAAMFERYNEKPSS